jgi:hypothetical protein
LNRRHQDFQSYAVLPAGCLIRSQAFQSAALRAPRRPIGTDGRGTVQVRGKSPQRAPSRRRRRQRARRRRARGPSRASAGGFGSSDVDDDLAHVREGVHCRPLAGSRRQAETMRWRVPDRPPHGRDRGLDARDDRLVLGCHVPDGSVATSATSGRSGRRRSVVTSRVTFSSGNTTPASPRNFASTSSRVPGFSGVPRAAVVWCYSTRPSVSPISATPIPIELSASSASGREVTLPLTAS